MSETLLSILSALVSILMGGLASYGLEIVRNISKKANQHSTSYSEKMETLTRKLVDASSEVDRVLSEMSEMSLQRENAISEYESKLKDLKEKHKHLEGKVEILGKVPVPAIEYFVSELEKGEKRSAWRDYVLFGLGVVVSTVITIALKLIWGI
jgi:uncharacterized phage infection (PIP) family protein YhgE